jgi:hypothetical protein
MYDFILNPVFLILFDLLQLPLHLLQLPPPGPEQDLNRVKTSPVDGANCTLKEHDYSQQLSTLINRPFTLSSCQIFTSSVMDMVTS